MPDWALLVFSLLAAAAGIRNLLVAPDRQEIQFSRGWNLALLFFAGVWITVLAVNWSAPDVVRSPAGYWLIKATALAPFLVIAFWAAFLAPDGRLVDLVPGQRRLLRGAAFRPVIVVLYLAFGVFWSWLFP